MNVLFAVFHPPHPYIVRNVAEILTKKGHKCAFIVHEKENIIEDIIKSFGFEYFVVTNQSEFNKSKIKFAFSYLLRSYSVFKKFKPDIVFSPTSPVIGFSCFFYRVPLVSWADTETAVHNLKISSFFCNYILTPDCFYEKVNKKKHIAFAGYKELAYLHPNYFKASEAVLNRLGINNDKKIILMRFSALKAMHDIGLKSYVVDFKENILFYITELEKYANVFISMTEKEIGEEFSKYKLKIHPVDYHHILAYSSIYIGEGTTTASEAGVLGIPWINIQKTKRGYLIDQEVNYGLGFRTDDIEMGFKTALEWIKSNDLSSKWLIKRQKLLSNKIDVTAFLVWFIENYPASAKIMKEDPDYQYNFK